MKQKLKRLALRVRWWCSFLSFLLTEAIFGPVWYACRYYRSLRERKTGDALLMEALAATTDVDRVLPIVKAWLETHGGRRRAYTWTIYPMWQPADEYIVIRSGTAYLKLSY
jgi:hypothetical protein